ncbi:ABC transporter permease [Teichococcus cervicalis]|uniref:ABC transporter, permease protein n=1 Tax=Pseudoroseomonas cervicalis ATCC 49957 TaxID=525371 RepID=D5RGZ4_9PROT|nr:ABC transporter permease [Pseudoroseomonas cervicalis]EFH13426.1 ABC transporter, permease protein [Pseudoroseomonas cervicalis ATCC 49957]
MSGERLRRGLYRFRRSWVSVLGLVIVLALLVIAILGPAIVPHPDHVAGLVQTGARFQPPSAEWWFGTNEVGQDVFSLTLAGTRISLLAGMAVVLVGAGVGVLAGAIAGFFGGWVDEVLMRLSDLMLTVPSLILAMAVAAALGPGTGNMIFAIALSWWPGYARLVRGEVMAKKEEQFVTAARAMGAGPARLLRRHILPNIISPVIVKMSLDMGFAILTVASLGFVGIGVKPPTPEWGSLLSVARANMPDYWWTAIFPGLAIFLAVFGFNLLGDGLRDLLDPKARR